MLFKQALLIMIGYAALLTSNIALAESSVNQQPAAIDMQFVNCHKCIKDQMPEAKGFIFANDIRLDLNNDLVTPTPNQSTYFTYQITVSADRANLVWGVLGKDPGTHMHVEISRSDGKPMAQPRDGDTNIPLDYGNFFYTVKFIPPANFTDIDIHFQAI